VGTVTRVGERPRKRPFGPSFFRIVRRVEITPVGTRTGEGEGGREPIIWRRVFTMSRGAQTIEEIVPERVPE